jgi:hypothetical protein
MSNIALRVGRFFALHTLDEALPKRRPAATPLPLGEGARRAGEGQRATTAPGSSGRDDLAFFGLCMEVNHDDPRAEIDRLSLVSPEAVTWEKTPLLLM